MPWRQQQISLRPRQRGFHLITDEIEQSLPWLDDYGVGLIHLLLQHTSASLCLNENADPDVRRDLAAWSDRRLAPEREPYFVHTVEGPDDMPAHIKAATFGVELTLPIQNGRMALGTWQGIYLGEHRNHGGSRRVLATVQGETVG